MARDGMRVVDLTDDGEPPTGSGTSSPPPGRPERAPSLGEPRQGARRWIVAAAVVLAAVLVAGVVVDGLRERDRASRLADVPGVLEPMDASLRELWSQPGGWFHAVSFHVDPLFAVFDGAGGGTVLVANDARTGDKRWEQPFTETSNIQPSCAPLVDATDRTTHLACQVLEAPAGGAGTQGTGPIAGMRLLVFDAATGTRVQDRAIASGFEAVADLEGDLVVLEILGDGRARVTRQDASSGEARWRWTSPDPMPHRAVGFSEPAAGIWDDVIAVDGPAPFALTTDGELLRQWPAERTATAEDGWRDLTVLPGGRYALSDPGPGAPGTRYGMVSSWAGGDEDGFAIPGPLLVLEVDDRSAVDVLLTAPPGSTQVVAVDAQTGRTRWTADKSPTAEALVVDRRLVTASPDGIVALDTRTGDRLWTAMDGKTMADQGLLTDGVVALVPHLNENADSTLTALELTDGRVRWTVTGPEAVRGYGPMGGRLIAFQDEQAVGLG